MARFHRPITLAVGAVSLAGIGLVPSALPSSAAAASVSGRCSAGAHTPRTELSEFFTEWFDTAYPTASGATEPDITGPGLDGPGFLCKNA
jgi:hypothetical protein